MMDRYSNYAELAANEREGTDFEIIVRRQNNASTVIIAPHAGGIEPKTGYIASAIAGNDYSLYCFQGLKIHNNHALHIASHKFDEPGCLKLVANHEKVITIHGCNEEGERVFIGGRDINLIGSFLTEFSHVGIITEENYKYSGTLPENICNRGKTNKGVQFELSLQFRNGNQVPLFVKTVRKVLYGLNASDGHLI